MLIVLDAVALKLKKETAAVVADEAGLGSAVTAPDPHAAGPLCLRLSRAEIRAA